MDHPSPTNSSPQTKLDRAPDLEAQRCLAEPASEICRGTLPRFEPSLARDPALRSNPRLHVVRLRSASPELDREITIYLPEAYREQPTRCFPVFYLHDGQNLFDGETSYLPGHTWRCHTTADSLIAAGVVEPLILVGIANAGMRRMPEYTPTADPQFGGGEGDRYGTLILNELKPLMDRTWRTFPDAAHTGMGGASLGGLISLYLALTHRTAISRIAVISPSLWWDRRNILSLVRQASPDPELRIWLDMGTAEGSLHLHDTDQFYGSLLERGWLAGEQVVYQRIAGGVHNEDAWAARFGDVLRFLYPVPGSDTLAQALFDPLAVL